MSTVQGDTQRPLTDRELQLVRRVFSDPTSFPVGYRAWLKALIELEATPPGLGGHVIQDEGISLPNKPRLDFAGAGVVATDQPGKTLVTIGGVTSGTPSLASKILSTPGLMAFWPLDDAAGSTTAADASGNGHPLVNVPGGSSLYGNPTVPFAFGAPELIAGHTCAYSGRARAMMTAAALTGWMSGDCSGEIWFLRTSGGGGTLLACDSSSGNAFAIGLHPSSDSAGVRDRLSLGVGATELILGDSISGANVITHVAFTRTSGVWRLYHNGVLQSTTSSGAFLTPTNFCRVGHAGTSGTFTVAGEFNTGTDQTAGRIGYAAVYNVALDAATIAGRIAAGGPEPAGKVLSADGAAGTAWAYPTVESRVNGV